MCAAAFAVYLPWHRGTMGIRYYANAFAANMADRVIEDPTVAFPQGSCTDRWGARQPMGVVGPRHASWHPNPSVSLSGLGPQQPLLYLDKAWRPLQLLTGPNPMIASPGRPAFEMFRGMPSVGPTGSCTPFWRAINPRLVAAISVDLDELRGVQLERQIGRRFPNLHVGDMVYEYLVVNLDRVRTYVQEAADRGAGIAYMIG